MDIDANEYCRTDLTFRWMAGIPAEAYDVCKPRSILRAWYVLHLLVARMSMLPHWYVESGASIRLLATKATISLIRKQMITAFTHVLSMK
jgi:hypothetical protein